MCIIKGKVQNIQVNGVGGWNKKQSRVRLYTVICNGVSVVKCPFYGSFNGICPIYYFRNSYLSTSRNIERFGLTQGNIVCPTPFLTIYLLTYSMVQSPSLVANWFAASQEIPCISRNPKVHYRTHKCPPPVSILGQPYQVHIPTFHLLEIHPNILYPSTPRSPQWSPSLRFPHQDHTHSPLFTHTRHMPSLSYSHC